jgi:hypothetical protein
VSLQIRARASLRTCTCPPSRFAQMRSSNPRIPVSNMVAWGKTSAYYQQRIGLYNIRIILHWGTKAFAKGAASIELREEDSLPPFRAGLKAVSRLVPRACNISGPGYPEAPKVVTSCPSAADHARESRRAWVSCQRGRLPTVSITSPILHARPSSSFTRLPSGHHCSPRRAGG